MAGSRGKKTLAELERGGLIRKFDARPSEIVELLELAERDLRVSEKNIPINSDWAFSMAYNSILQLGRAWMFLNGWREASEAGHVAVVEFVNLTLGSALPYEALAFDGMRKKWRFALYSKAGAISSSEADEALRLAREFFGKLAPRIRKKLGK